ncbi:MAG TPA: FCD domain-containing protein [Alphaproteobacteria bacterium]|nr:FCD domain-containing protein [Alphaproteobacteria bacterium]
MPKHNLAEIKDLELIAGGVSGAATFEAIVRDRLRNDILTGELAPGARLRIKQLCDRYEVGATPIREALSKLASEGLAVAEENKGFSVAPLTIEELRDITQLRQIIEGQAFRLAIQNGDDRWESEIVASYHRLSRVITQPLSKAYEQRLAWERRHQEFHLALISACENRKLMRIAESLYSLLVRYRQILQTADMTTEGLLKIHQQLVDAALDRNLKSAAPLMAEHVNVNVETVLDAAAREPVRFAALGLQINVPVGESRRRQSKNARSRSFRGQ